MAGNTRCPDCMIGKRMAGAACRYCTRIHTTVAPRRVPIMPAARRFAIVTVAAMGTFAAARAGVYAWRWSLMSDMKATGIYDRDSYHLTNTLVVFTTALFLLANAVSGIQSRKFVNAGHANGLTRPEVGLRWLRTMPSSRTHVRWQWGLLGCWIGLAGFNVAFRSASTPEEIQTGCVAEIVVSLAFIVAAVGLVRAALRVAAEFEAQMAEHDIVPVEAQV